MIGAGHSGLAMSRSLAERSLDHVVLERGEVANAWKKDRWDSLRLLTPNFQSRLPGFEYEGDEPNGFMSVPGVIGFIEAYADLISAPVETGTTVTSVRWSGRHYEVSTDRGDWRCRAVVLASGACNRPAVPAVSAALPAGIVQLHPFAYRNPDQLPEGGVLVVGASATGLQLAHEIHRSGRPVTLSVGEHVRLPRTYRGRDIQWWMEAAGILDEDYREVDDIVRARNVPSPQLVGTKERATLNLNVLTDMGVRLVGRFAGVANGTLQFSGSLPNVCALADLKMGRLLGTIDEWAAENGLDAEVPPAERFEATRVEASPPLTLDATSGQIRTVLWATGFRPDFSWVDVPVMDRQGRLRHDGGAVVSPGMYVLGLTFLRRRKSSFIHGAEDDVRDLSDHLSSHLAGRAG